MAEQGGPGKGIVGQVRMPALLPKAGLQELAVDRSRLEAGTAEDSSREAVDMDTVGRVEHG